MSNKEEFCIEDGKLIRYNGQGGDETIPEGVTSIGNLSFSFCDRLTSIDIPESVTNIDDNSFRRCRNLTIYAPKVQSAKEETADLKLFLDAIRECTDITELTSTLVNTLIKKIEVFNSVKGTDGKKHVPLAIHFRAIGIITIPDEKELIEAMEEMQNPVNVA